MLCNWCCYCFGENWGIIYITNSDRRSDDRKYVCGSLATPQGTVDGFQSGQKTEDSSVTFSYPRWPPIKAYLQSVVLKTRHSKTKTEARSTQNSKTKHPKLENEAPKSRKRSTQNSKTKHLNLENEAPKTRNHCRLNNYNFTSCMTQSELGGGSGCVRTSKGPQNPFQGF